MVQVFSWKRYENFQNTFSLECLWKSAFKGSLNENRSCLYLTLTYLHVRQNHGEILKEFKPFVPNAPFLYPLKTLRFFDVFGG